MHTVQIVILGLIQGLTEFIPVSSSGHLVIAQTLFSGASDHLFLEFIDVGTTFALLIYFRKKIVSIIHDIFVKKNITLARNIIITAVPAGIVGYSLSDFINSSWFFGSIVVVTVGLALVGIVMVILEKLPMAKPVESGEKLSPMKALIIGIVQVLALIPGVSRSGTTIVTGRLAGLSPASAAEYSFLASLPIMLGVMLKLFAGSTERAYMMTHLSTLLISNLAAFIAGLFAVGFMLRYLSRHSLALFGWYRIGLAAIITVVLLVQ
ncbi:undecaprenyl-diphosphate phosphatase [Patescibacteria group bacterium]|nr:MAG: undecaprenyl-diphosphate phosphatase [Patescibacteria group bacterium]